MIVCYAWVEDGATERVVKQYNDGGFPRESSGHLYCIYSPNW